MELQFPYHRSMVTTLDSSDAEVVPTAWMGDALASGVMSLVGGVACRFDVGYLSRTYDVRNRKEGWVAFAWQVVLQLAAFFRRIPSVISSPSSATELARCMTRVFAL